MIVVINSSLYVITMSLLPFLIYTKWQDNNHLPDEFVNWGVIVNLFRVSAGTAASFLWKFFRS